MAKSKVIQKERRAPEATALDEYSGPLFIPFEGVYVLQVSLETYRKPIIRETSRSPQQSTALRSGCDEKLAWRRWYKFLFFSLTDMTIVIRRLDLPGLCSVEQIFLSGESALARCANISGPEKKQSWIHCRSSR